MRAFGSILAGFVTAAALAADPAPVERLDVQAVKPTPHGAIARATFSAPMDAAARDLHSAALAVRVGDDATVVFDANTRGLRIHRSGLRARFTAPKRSKMRIQKFALSIVAGAFDLSLRGGRLDSRSAPLVELNVAGHLYRFDPAFPDGPPPAVIPLPAGPVEFNTCTRNDVSIASTVTSTVLRSQTDLTEFLATVTPLPDDAAVLRQNDFSRNMIVVALGDATAQGVLPWAVRITNVRSDGRTLAVSYDKLQPSSASAGAAPGGGPPRSAFYHAISVPTSGMPVQFTATPVEALNPWN